MEQPAIVDSLKNIVQMDIQSVSAYGHAVEEVTLTHMKQFIAQFQNDHAYHIKNLSDMIHRLSGEQFEVPGGTGSQNETIYKMGCCKGLEEALHSLENHESMMNELYREILSKNLPAELKFTLGGNLRDEARHLQYIKQAIENKMWGSPAAT